MVVFESSCIALLDLPPHSVRSLPVFVQTENWLAFFYVGMEALRSLGGTLPPRSCCILVISQHLQPTAALMHSACGAITISQVTIILRLNETQKCTAKLISI